MSQLVALDKDCWFCGGYLPRRLRTGGIHILCSHAYDTWEETPMTTAPLTDAKGLEEEPLPTTDLEDH